MNHQIPTTGVCHELCPNLAPAPAADQENIGACNQDRNEEEREFQLGSSTVVVFWFAAFQIVSLQQIICVFAVPFHFNCHAIPILKHVCLSLILQEQPVRLALFAWQRSPTQLVQPTTPKCHGNVKLTWLPWTSREKKKKKKKVLKDLNAMQAQDEKGLHEVVEGFMGNIAARMAPNILELVRKTTPAGLALSEEQINTLRCQRLRKDLWTMKSSDKEGHAALVADQIEDHHLAKKTLPKVLDKVRSTTSGKMTIAEAFVPGGARLNLGGRGESKSAINKKNAAAAKIRLGVKNNVGTPFFRATLKANTPGKPSTRENTISAPNFDAAANTPRTIWTPLETITNVPMPEAGAPSCAKFCCSPNDRSSNKRAKRRRVSFGLVACCSPVAEEASYPYLGQHLGYHLINILVSD
jgi:hypothetical protein